MKHIKTINRANLSATAKKAVAASVRLHVSLLAKLHVQLAIRNVLVKVTVKTDN